jgi:transcriptional regulator with GAF, ATPase, and Fis domain
MSNALKHQEVLKLKDLLADENRYLHDELQRLSGDEIIGADFGLKGVLDLVHQVAPLASPVLLLGETGTGKEVIASAIHRASPRRDNPFIRVNCGAIPETLMDSELFGHEKGAFTGALSQKRGRFERAHDGTIFLDEIGELPPEAQVRLLRVLQEKEIERVGGTESLSVDIRVIAATHRDLPHMIAQGTFREDLYFRLKVFPINIPPLRERRGDIPALVQHFLHKKASEMKLGYEPTLTASALERLMAYDWPGNVRELENAVERALILNQGKPLTFADLDVSPHPFPDSAEREDELLTLDQVMDNHIRNILKMTGGKVEGKGGAAELLGLNPGTLRHRMRKLGIPFGRNVKTG